MAFFNFDNQQLESNISQPEGFYYQLFQHQLISLEKMENLEEKQQITRKNETITTKFGILADKMGYGKTIVVLALIFQDKLKCSDTITHYSVSDSYLTSSCKRYKKIASNINIVLMSKSIMKQWEEHCKLCKIPFMSITNTKMLNEFDITKDNEISILFVVDKFYNELMAKCVNYIFKRVIIDDPQQLEITSMITPNATFYWFITATPHLVKDNFCRRRSPHFLKTTFERIDYVLGNFIVKNTDAVLELSFNMPKTKFINHKCYTVYNKYLNVNDGDLKQFIESNNMEGLYNYLGRGESQKSLKELLIVRAKTVITNLELDLANAINRIYVDKSLQTEMVRKLTNRIVSAKNSLLEVQEIEEDKEEIDCKICYLDEGLFLIENHCNNTYCIDCVNGWLKKNDKCPTCQHTITMEDFTPIKTVEREIKEEEKLTKDACILKILKTAKKTIIYSSSKAGLKVLQMKLQKENVDSLILHGTIQTINKDLESYHKNRVNVLLLSIDSFGAGIDLQDTTDIIIYHELFDDTKKQIIGRANRIGRTTPLNVHVLEF